MAITSEDKKALKTFEIWVQNNDKDVAYIPLIICEDTVKALKHIKDELKGAGLWD